MSDIAIRFDGLILAISLIAAASIYFLVAFIALIIGVTASGQWPRAFPIARTASIFGALYLAGLGLLSAYLAWAGQPATGPDRLDWLTAPVLILFVAGCVRLGRSTPASAHQP